MTTIFLMLASAGFGYLVKLWLTPSRQNYDIMMKRNNLNGLGGDERIR